MLEVKRLFDYLALQVEKRTDKPFLSHKVTSTEGKEWKTYTFAETKAMVNRVSQLLINLGVSKNETIALISNNCPEWNFIDLGCQQIGAVCVPMYPTISEKDYEFIFNDANIRFAFVGNDEINRKVQPLLVKCSMLKGVYNLEKMPGSLSLLDVLSPIEKVNGNALKQRMDAISENDLATIIYTSGTTGNPKGVMLTHRNIVSDIQMVGKVLPYLEEEIALSFLPLCHSYERAVFYSYLSQGMHIYYAESLETIGDNLKEVHPYCFTTVPRLLEKVYERIMQKADELKGFKRKLFFWALELGKQYEPGGKQSPWYAFQLSIARKLVFSKWREALGGRIVFIVTGAAPVQPLLIRVFTAAGITIIEGYGLTETSPVLTVNRPDEKERRAGTVGIPLPGVEIKIAVDGEILAKGPNIMKGYYNRPDLTAEVIDTEGWFHTGDIGQWQEGRFLKITDRKKELFKTSGGKYIAPQVIENKMKESRYIDQIMIVGESHKFIAALIVPSFPNVTEWARQHAIAATGQNQLIEHPGVKALIHQEIEKYNHDFGHWEQVKKFVLMGSEWSVDTGELTPTMKLKRKVIMEKYKQAIENIYSEQ